MPHEDTFCIDSHKLIYHPERVAAWLKGKDIFPLYIEINPFAGCNHRCIFCGFDYLGYKPTQLNSAALKRFLRDIASCGVKSVMFSGEGETLLHPELSEMVRYAKSKGLDVAVTTNGVLLNQKLMRRLLPVLSWLRISLNAGTKDTYSLVHRTNPTDFTRVIANIKEAVQLKRKHGHGCTIGIQFLLLNENYHEAAKLAALLKKIGADYLIIKPYSQHPYSINRLKKGLDYKKFLALEEQLAKYRSKDFQIIFRRRTMAKIAQEKPYKQCLGLSFSACLSSNGDLYACTVFLGDNRFCLGNINRTPFRKIWQGKKRKQVLKMMRKEWDIGNCREVCRLDEINRYLWGLSHPPEHVNFV